MCGIIGIVSDKGNIKGRIIEGLKRLEYRGYDSAGVAIKTDSKIFVHKKKGKVYQMEEELKGANFPSRVGIGHTRWATHGEPSDPNSHPHSDCRGEITLAHNGIIENYQELKEELRGKGHRFRSQTDSEVIAHLLEEYTGEGANFLDALKRTVNRLEGSFALVILNSKEDALYFARKDSPLVLGLGEGENFAASDVPAFLPWTNRVIFLENGEMGKLTPSGVEIYKFSGEKIDKPPTTITWSLAQAEKSGYKHFMLKEIHEQAKAIGDTVNPRINRDRNSVVIEELPISPTEINHILIIACGTSYHAGLVGKFYLEEIAGIKTEVDYASEFRYRKPVLPPSTLTIAVSQSGETADTIGALRKARQGSKSLAICNVLGSSITREADATLYTHAGPEISVASTKAFTTQLSLLLLLALYLGRERGIITPEQEADLVSKLLALPSKIEQMLRSQEEKIRQIGIEISSYRNALYLGRHLNYPIALEGALKLKEISYIHAEGYPAGEMKHGPIALIDESLPTVFIATESKVLDKVRSNMEEIKSRRGRIVSLISGKQPAIEELSDGVIRVPQVDEYLYPIINIIPLQLVAYYAADFLGHDVDQPRNLAKSVTVE